MILWIFLPFYYNFDFNYFDYKNILNYYLIFINVIIENIYCD